MGQFESQDREKFVQLRGLDGTSRDSITSKVEKAGLASFVLPLAANTREFFFFFAREEGCVVMSSLFRNAGSSWFVVLGGRHRVIICL